MHELSLCRTILKKIEQIESIEQYEQVTQIYLSIGALSCIDIDTLKFAFNSISKSTIANSAQLECEIVTAQALCHTCQQTYTPKTLFSFCVICESSNTSLINGNEFILKHIEVR